MAAVKVCAEYESHRNRHRNRHRVRSSRRMQNLKHVDIESTTERNQRILILVSPLTKSK